MLPLYSPEKQISNEVIELFDSAEIAFMQIRLDTTRGDKWTIRIIV